MRLEESRPNEQSTKIHSAEEPEEDLGHRESLNLLRDHICGRDQNVGHSHEASERNAAQDTGNRSEGLPCYTAAENLEEPCLPSRTSWKAELDDE